MKFLVMFSSTGINYDYWELVYKELMLKYTVPYTFSNLTVSNTGYPGFFIQDQINRQLLESNYPTNPITVDVNKRRIWNKVDSVNQIIDYNYRNSSELFFFNVSSILGRNKFYFEVSSETGVNYTNYPWSVALMLNFDLTRVIGNLNNGYPSPLPPMFGLTNLYSGYYNDPYSQYDSNGGTTPSALPAFRAEKKGFIGGYAIDLINNKIELVNSPYDNRAITLTGINTPLNNNSSKPKLQFTINSAGRYGSLQCDLSFNFGQDPFIGPVPLGYDGRIGQRWEMEIDPLYSYKNISGSFMNQDGLFPGIEFKQIDLEEPEGDYDKNFVIDVNLIHFIKGHITATDGKFTKRLVRLVTWPELFSYRETVSSTVDGLYEFVNIENRAYAVISQDTIGDTFEPEIIGPVFPKPMKVYND